MARGKYLSGYNPNYQMYDLTKEALKAIDQSTKEGKDQAETLKLSLERMKESRHDVNEARWRMFQNNGKRNVGRKAGRKTRY